jgi:hypothetical protein
LCAAANSKVTISAKAGMTAIYLSAIQKKQHLYGVKNSIHHENTNDQQNG